MTNSQWEWGGERDNFTSRKGVLNTDSVINLYNLIYNTVNVIVLRPYFRFPFPLFSSSSTI